MLELIQTAIKTGQPLRTLDGCKVLIFADLQALNAPDRYGFHYVGGYFFNGEFIENRWDAQGQSAHTNYLGNLVSIWEGKNE